MIKLTIIERIVITSILTLSVFISCLIFGIEIWKSFVFGLGSFSFQIVDYIVAYYRFKRK